jgi:hypothetical protein
LVLGIMIWRQFPVSGEWAVGTITGIHMIFSGSSVALLSRAARCRQRGVGRLGAEMPAEILELMDLYPQPVLRHPSVTYLPSRRRAD